MSFSSITVGAMPPAPQSEAPADDAREMSATPDQGSAPEPEATAPGQELAQVAEPEPPAPPPLAPLPPAPMAAPLSAGALLTRIDEPKGGGAGSFYWLAALASVLWIAGVAAFAYGFGSRAHVDSGTLVLVALLAVAPLGLIWAAAYAVGQARVLAGEARRAKRLTDELVGPTALAAAQVGAVVESMRGQIATAQEVANQARDHLTALREALATETERLAEATAHASRTAVGLVETLGRERGELNTLALTLDARSAAVADAINRQAHMVAEASDLAETQLREAEAALAARAADFAADAGEAVDVSRVAAEDLGRQIIRLETASGGVGQQLQALEEGLTQQRAALVTVAHGLRAEQEDFSLLAESRTAQLAQFLGAASVDVTALNDATAAGASSLSALIGEARARFGELAEAASAERDAFAQGAEGTLKTMQEAGAREREHLEAAMHSTIEALSAAAVEAREAADVHAEAARARVDLLNEAAFAAGQTADQVFEARLTQAQGLIEHAAQLVEDAGQKTAARLEAQVAAARDAMGQLNALIDDVTARAARLPEETGARAHEIKAAVEQGLDELLTSARRAAEETQAIDQAFQERVKRNYEMLSEAVQLMGVVASGGQGAAALQRSSPADRARSRVEAAAQQALARPAPSLAPPTARTPAEAPSPSPELPLTAGEPAAEAPLRGRLKLTPTASDDEFKAVFEAASGQPAPAATDDGGWTWKELLNTLDGDATPADGASASAPPVTSNASPEVAAAAPAESAQPASGDDLFDEIVTMGIDPNALLPKGRIEEIAAAVQTGDAAGAREVVRTLAPAAIRRIARRMLADPNFRARAQTLTVRYGEAVAEASQRDRQGFQAAALLGVNAGRAYLLLDAAAGQPG